MSLKEVCGGWANYSVVGLVHECKRISLGPRGSSPRRTIKILRYLQVLIKRLLAPESPDLRFLDILSTLAMPPVFQPSREARGSRSPLQPPPAQTERPTLRPGDVCVGCVVWLPSKDTSQRSIRCINDDCCGKGELDDGGYNHPVVVLKIRQENGSVVVGDLICTVACVNIFLL